jgi:hypothetical protein
MLRGCLAQQLALVCPVRQIDHFHSRKIQLGWIPPKDRCSHTVHCTVHLYGVPQLPTLLCTSLFHSLLEWLLAFSSRQVQERMWPQILHRQDLAVPDQAWPLSFSHPRASFHCSLLDLLHLTRIHHCRVSFTCPLRNPALAPWLKYLRNYFMPVPCWGAMVNYPSSSLLSPDS